MIKRCIILLAAVVFSTSYCFSQEFGMMAGYNMENQLLIDLHYATSNHFGVKLNVGFNLSPGTNGPNEIDVMGWNEFPEYIYEEGEFFNTFDIGIGYFNDFYVIGLIGIIDENNFKNGRDPYYRLGNYGEYCLVNDEGTKLNFGAEIGYSWKNYSLGTYWTQGGGFGAKIGFVLKRE